MTIICKEKAIQDIPSRSQYIKKIQLKKELIRRKAELEKKKESMKHSEKIRRVS